MSDLRYFSSTSNVLAVVVLSLAVAVLCALLVRSGRTKASVWELLGLSLPLLLILFTTLLRAGELPGFLPGGVLHWSDDGWNRISYNPWSNQVLLNAALFVPAGFAWTLARRRPFVVWLGLTGLSLLVELTQGLTGLGAPDVADLLANSAGAALGAAAGWAVLALVALRRGARPRPRTLLIRGALIAGAATAFLVFATVGAERRQARIERELVALYSGSSYQQFHRWDKTDQLVERVFEQKTPVLSDGARYGRRSVMLRYPASVFGIRRCVFATWTTGSFAVSRGHGRACTVFLG